ncbi:MAG: hypothetical protein ACREB5_04000, partial [Sphingomonadaceae bacterium]
MGLLGLAFSDIGIAASGNEPLDAASAGTRAVLASSLPDPVRNLQLETFVDGAPTQLIGAFHQHADGSMTIAPEQLHAIGIKPQEAALRADGLIDLGRLPGVSFVLDEAAQSIRFTATPAVRVPRIIRGGEGHATAVPKPQRSFGALLNYSLFASTGGKGIGAFDAFEGVSGRFETRIFSPAGVFSNGFIAAAYPHQAVDLLRLDTVWSYADPGKLISYRAGDIIVA